jgi:hypothetical protein
MTGIADRELLERALEALQAELDGATLQWMYTDEGWPHTYPNPGWRVARPSTHTGLLFSGSVLWRIKPDGSSRAAGE